MSRIEQLIGEIEEYIDSCKFQPLSNSKIIVNKEEMEELLVELRLRVPEEIKKYQKIISQQDAILADAKSQAETLITEAKVQTEEMLSDNEIMQQAYAKANALVQDAQNQADIIVLDFHAETTSEKLAMAHYLDGRADIVVGTHTHVQTADARILPGGTAYITDLGMVGAQNSVLGVRTDLVIQKFRTGMPVRFDMAEGPAEYAAVIVDIDPAGQRTASIEPLLLREAE